MKSPYLLNLTGRNQLTLPIPIGTKVKPWGKIVGVTNHGGERYYFFAENGVALIPAYDVERQSTRPHEGND